MSQQRSRMKKGILGVPRDPARPMLFTFKGDGWPSDDDSEDSDYSPTNPAKTKKARHEASSNLKQQSEDVLEDAKESKPHPEPENAEISKDKLVPTRGSLCVTFKSVDADSEAVNGLHIPGVILVPKPKQRQHKKHSADGASALSDESTTKKKRRSAAHEGSSKDSKEGAAKKRKRKKPEGNKVKGITFAEAQAESNSDGNEDGPWGKSMPVEILVKIFSHVVHSDGVFPFLPRAEKVCKLWNEAAKELSLWEKVDVSWGRVKYSEEHLVQLCKKCFSRTKELNLAGWGNTLTLHGINAIANNCPLLTSINLSRCTKITSECLRILADRCPLASIDLSGTSKSYNSNLSAVSPSSLKYLLSKCGERLTHIIIAENDLAGYQSVINAISESCPNLLVLDTSNPCGFPRNMVLQIEKLQHGCPKLRVLRLANAPISLASTSYALQAQSPGFPDLEELSIAVDSENSFGMTDSGFERIVKASHKLKLLDIRGCRNISVSGLVRVPAWDIQQLYLSQCSATRTSDLELVLQKWRHSLIEVDLSWVVNEEAVNQAVLALATDESDPPLRHLDLSGSAVSYKTIKTLLNGCSNLHTLNLQSCRGLPRGMKRLHSFEDLERLREEVRDGRFD